MSRWKVEAKRALRQYPKAKARGDTRIMWAVETALEMQREYYNAAARLRMVDLVHFRRTHTLEGAAVETGYSPETVKRWNTEILSAVYVGLLKTRAEG